MLRTQRDGAGKGTRRGVQVAPPVIQQADVVVGVGKAGVSPSCCFCRLTMTLSAGRRDDTSPSSAFRTVFSNFVPGCF